MLLSDSYVAYLSIQILGKDTQLRIFRVGPSSRGYHDQSAAPHPNSWLRRAPELLGDIGQAVPATRHSDGHICTAVEAQHVHRMIGMAAGLRLLSATRSYLSVTSIPTVLSTYFLSVRERETGLRLLSATRSYLSVTSIPTVLSTYFLSVRERETAFEGLVKRRVQYLTLAFELAFVMMMLATRWLPVATHHRRTGMTIRRKEEPRFCAHQPQRQLLLCNSNNNGDSGGDGPSPDQQSNVREQLAKDRLIVISSGSLMGNGCRTRSP